MENKPNVCVKIKSCINRKLIRTKSSRISSLIKHLPGVNNSLYPSRDRQAVTSLLAEGKWPLIHVMLNQPLLSTHTSAALKRWFVKTFFITTA